MIKQLIFLAAAGLFLWPQGAGWAGSAAAAAGKIKVETTLFPVYDMCRAVGGDMADVFLLLPPGIEPHSFEPTPGDIVRINDSDIFIYTADAMEPWVARILPGITNQNLLVLEAARGLVLRGHDGPARGDAGHDHGDVDPHVWLDFANDQEMLDTIAQAFVERDPEHKTAYLENADTYKAALAALDRKYREALQNCRTRTIIYAGHFAFGYMAARYGLDHISPYAGFSPDAEPSPRAVAELIRNMRAHKARTIYYEELIDPKAARVIAEETGAETVLLDAAHNISADAKAAGVTFLSIMEDDLVRLRKGLMCP